MRSLHPVGSAVSCEEYRQRCTAAALTAGSDLSMMQGMPVYGPYDLAERIKQLNELQVRTLAALYGCKPAAIERAGLVSMGEVKPGSIEDAPMLGSVQRHRVRDDWRTVKPSDFSDLKDLNLELRGLSRAIWLALLWSGGSVVPFKRRWYHHSELVSYWALAWSCTYGCPEEHKDDKRFQLITYAFAVSAEYTRRHPKDRTHKAAEYFLQAAQQWGLYD